MPIIKGLMNYIDEENISFHMPGHKNNRMGFEELELIKNNLYKMDNTEVPGLDNLHMPEGMILEAQKNAAILYKSKYSYFVVNGSTAAIYAMIMGSTKPGDKIIIQRNSHRSVFMACLLGDLNPVYIKPDILEDFELSSVVNIENLINVMNENPEAKAVVITCPTYYGICCDLEEIAREAHKRNMLLLVDEAHGAHFPFNERLPKSAMECSADVSVVSIHKSLPALTQSSLININDRAPAENIKFMLRLFQTTSPSYILMASMDAALGVMEREGNELLNNLLDNIQRFENRIKKITKYKMLGSEVIGISSIKDIDKTKIVINSELGGTYLENLLRNNYHIQVEMSDLNNIVLITSVGNTKEDFDALYNALYDISLKYNQKIKEIPDLSEIPETQRVLSFKESYYMGKKKVRLSEAEGLISAEIAAPYPPGIPILLPGDRITKEAIHYLEVIKQNKIPVNGMEDSSGEYILANL